MSDDEILNEIEKKEKEYLQTIIKNSRIEIKKLKKKNEALYKDYKETKDELDSIKYSRSYRIIQKIKCLFGRKQNG